MISGDFVRAAPELLVLDDPSLLVALDDSDSPRYVLYRVWLAKAGPMWMWLSHHFVVLGNSIGL